MGYDFVAKEMHRAGLVALYYQNPTAPILYLDGEDGEATRCFLKTWRIPEHHLVPVNLKASVVEDIERNHPWVVGRAGNINTILSDASADSFSVVWLDYMCRFDEHVHVRACVDALRAASFVSVTFSTRALDKGLLSDALRSKMKTIGKLVENVTPYKGKSDIENMLKFTIGRRTVSTDVFSDVSTDVFSDVFSDVSTHHVAKGDKVFVTYRGVDLTAVVLEGADERSLVRFDCDSQERWVDRAKMVRNESEIDMTPLLGAEIGIPIKVFRQGLKGYEATKQSKKSVFFTIGKRYRKTARYTVHAVSRKGGGCYRKAERWTITPEQAACWVKG